MKKKNEMFIFLRNKEEKNKIVGFLYDPDCFFFPLFFGKMEEKKGIRMREEWPTRCVEVEMVVAVQRATLSLFFVILLLSKSIKKFYF